ncbi:MAG: DEAD/DEAH box helicase [Spirochaetia bacterium]|nr:DEAD/DEAH box helicase [Spirochaetota bacterium]MCX8097184.1 DEAD/DEAH box helicase [Spirochaetota bacterium]MDW8112643.1 DEAD/DEAH box helicase [Spirochaetia bacterium]
MDEKLKLQFDIYSKFDIVHVKPYTHPEYEEGVELCEYSKTLLEKLGIKLYKHQAEAINKFSEGNNVALVTPTASGKTLAYLISYLEELYKDQNAVALYIAPTNALINDQAKKVDSYIGNVVPFVEVYPLTSGTSDSVRARIKSRGGFVLTNPEMLVYSLILYNRSWERFWKNLKVIIVDEIHEMSGIKGSHFGNIIRLVNMLNHVYGNNARYFALSGTIGNPKSFIENLFGKKFVIIDKSTSGNKKVEFLLPNRIYLSTTSSSGRIVDTLRTFVDTLSKKTIVFVNSRRMVERITKIIKNSKLSHIISPYRSGYNHKDRVAIENMFKDGKIKGLITTSAFEMGIDIGDLDVVCAIGFPFSKISLRQRFGRTGRIRDGTVVFFPTENILDNYYYNNPQELFSDEVENLSANVLNDRIIGYYIATSIIAYNEATESTSNYITDTLIEKYWGQDSIYTIEKFIKNLSDKQKGVLFGGANHNNEKYFFTQLTKNDIRRMVNIRGIGVSFDIYDVTKNKRIGEISIERIFWECHPGGIYIHMGDSYEVVSLDFDNKIVRVKPTEKDFSTEVINDKDIEILGVIKTKKYKNLSLNYCKLRVKEIYTGYIKFEYRPKNVNGEIINEKVVISYTEYPSPYTLEYETEGVVILFDGREIRKIIKYDEDIKFVRSNRSMQNYKINEENILRAGLHSAEHSIIGMYPSEILCSRSEIGGLSYVSEGEMPAIFIYEGVEGGVGYSEIAFEKFDRIVRRAFLGVKSCSCKEDSGCPACIQSPKCGNANNLLSKRIGLKVLSFILDSLESSVVENKEVLTPRLVKYSITHLRKDIPEVEENEKYGYYNLLEYPLENFRKPLVFDVETQMYSYEVGGWDNAKDMRLSIAVVYDIKEDNFLIFNENNVRALIDLLFSSDIVIGYNTRNFDYKVLSRYDKRFEVSDNVKTFDILNDLIKRYVGETRISLNNLVKNNINKVGKTMHSKDMPNFFREGKIDLVIKHCEEDVIFTYEIMKKILKDRCLKYENKNQVFTIEFDEVIFRFKL